MPDSVIIDDRPKTTTTTSRKPELEKPGHYKVIIVNDDVTPVSIVLSILIGVFRLNERRAVAIMMEAHQKGSATVSVYPKEIAETKATAARERSSAAGAPIRFLVEEA